MNVPMNNLQTPTVPYRLHERSLCIAKVTPPRDMARLKQAQANLCNLMIRKGEAVLVYLKCELEITSDAPENYSSLVSMVRNSHVNRAPFLIQKEGLSGSIYGNTLGNIAFRVWHDWLHYHMPADFSIMGEARVAEHQLAYVEAEFGKGSLEAKLFTADTIGQVMYYQIHGKFPEDQMAFVLSCLNEY